MGASAFVAIAAACACSPTEDTEARDPTAYVQSSTQFAPAPASITDLVPTAEQLTVLYNATTDYSIREEDRARFLEGPSDKSTLRLAQTWGALPTPPYFQFTTVESVGADMINATGQGHLAGVEPYPVGPIPFVRSNDEWKLSRTYVCDVLTALAAQQGGCD